MRLLRAVEEKEITDLQALEEFCQEQTKAEVRVIAEK